jgi:hypothetical protein
MDMIQLDRIKQCLPLNTCPGPGENQQNCLQRIEQAIVDTWASLGFDFVRYTSVAVASESDTIAPAFNLNFSTFPPDWDKQYEDCGYAMYDPVFSILLGQYEGQYITYGNWRDLEAVAVAEGNSFNLPDDAFTDEGRLLVYSELKGYGIHSGQYLFLQDSDGSRTLVLLSSKRPQSDFDDELTEAFWRQVLAMVIQVNFSSNGTRRCATCDQHLRIAGGERVVINPQQIAIMEFYLNNPKATAKMVGNTLHIAETTVNYHLKEIRKKFNMPGNSGYALAQFAKQHRVI